MFSIKLEISSSCIVHQKLNRNIFFADFFHFLHKVWCFECVFFFTAPQLVLFQAKADHPIITPYFFRFEITNPKPYTTPVTIKADHPITITLKFQSKKQPTTPESGGSRDDHHEARAMTHSHDVTILLVDLGKVAIYGASVGGNHPVGLIETAMI